MVYSANLQRNFKPWVAFVSFYELYCMNLFLVFIGGGFGAASRFLISQLFPYSNWPWATHLANAFAAAILALVYFTDKTDKFEFSPGFFIFITVGYCGGLSTFSTFSLECFQWMVTGMWLKLISYILIQLLTSLGLIYLVGKFIQ